MKKLIILFAAAGMLLGACHSAKRAEAEKQRTREKMDQLEKDQKSFEQKNQQELRK
jgi:protein involved in sex pheromone biosynthesis